MDQIIGLEPIQSGHVQKWTITLDGPEVNLLRHNYRDTFPEEEFDRTLRSASRILEQCPSPDSKIASKIGIAIGKIQSGKTLSFTTLIALAAANKYSTIIVLAGTKKNLLNQTYDRLSKDLGIGMPKEASRIYISKNPTITDAANIGNAIKSGRCVLLPILKRAPRINQVRRLLTSQDIPLGPTLIIDDECDEASLNNYLKKGKQSSTYKAIVNLRESLRLHAYIAYTATPQANLLLPTIDNLSPDFGQLIEPGKSYCGGSMFFGDRINEFVVEIVDIQVDKTEIDLMPDSLKDALAVFFVGATIRHQRVPRQNHSMLIHMSSKKKDHENMRDHVETLIKSWRQNICLRQKDPTRQSMIKHFKSAYKALSKTVSSIPEWEYIESQLHNEMNCCGVYMVNSLPEGTQIAETTFQLENNIVIGGNILGRGVTIEDLTVSYMIRRAGGQTNADTMEQRARWFGYKEEYLDLCRIYLPKQIKDDFVEILRFEDDFWDSLRRSERQGIPIREWKRFFLLASRSYEAAPN